MLASARSFNGSFKQSLVRFAPLILILCACLLGLSSARTPSPQEGDAPRYIQAGFNLYHFGILSSQEASPKTDPASVEPSWIMGGPLIAVEGALLQVIDPSSRRFFSCHVSKLQNCANGTLGITAFNLLGLAIFLICVYLAAHNLILTCKPSVEFALLALIIAILSSDLHSDLRSVSTEYIYLAGTGLLLYAISLINHVNRRFLCWSLMGSMYAIVILIKPIFLYGLSFYIIGLAIINRQFSLKNYAIFFGFITIVLIGFYFRSLVVLGTLQISDASLLSATFSHRVAYNEMNWTTWAIGWLYFMPDFGDSLVSSLFEPGQWQRLSWSSNSFYVTGRDQLHGQLITTVGADHVSRTLATDYVLAEPLKHMMVSILLFWRGILISSYFSLLALLAMLYSLSVSSPVIAWRPLLTMLLFLLSIAGGQALISVSIPRYNLALTLPYAIFIAVAGLDLFKRIRILLCSLLKCRIS